MKKKTVTRVLVKKILCMMAAAALFVSAMPATLYAQDDLELQNDFSDFTSVATLVNPALKQYDVKGDGSWKVTTSTRLVVEATPENMENERLAEVIKLVNSEFMEKGIPSSSAMPMVYAAEGARTADDIQVMLADVSDISSDTVSNEAYKIEIGSDGVLVKAASENAVIYALRTIQALMITNKELPYGTILDYPDVAERRLHVDCARKYISKDWFIRQIREMSYLKMNTIQMHFSENLGFRIECETDPAIVSDEYLTKAEVREILEEARKYGIKVIPSFDSPGHVDQILKAHPEYGQVNSSGGHYASGLDVTNEEAVAYIYSLYDEYMELFGDYCDEFHIGGDEYMEFDRAPFTTQYQSVLNNYAVEKYGTGYTWKDVMAGYINDLAAYVYSKGFKPRIWNDGIYYGESSSSPQKIEMHKYIGIDFWSQMSWNSSIARLQTFIDKGHTDIYNVNASYFYYVLRPSAPTDGREQHSFDYLNQDQRIYNTWTPGAFQENTIADDNPNIKGASMAIWCDKADVCTEDVITEDIASALRALACKSWDIEANNNLSWEDFSKVCNALGNAAGFAKGSQLPDSGEFTPAGELGKVTVHYVDEKGNKLQDDQIKYGNFDARYEIEAPEIYGYRLTSAASASGIYTESDQEVTFVYEKYCDKSSLKAEIEGKLLERDYIAETYTEYKEAYAAAKTVYDNADSEQKDVDDALAALLAAKGKTVSLEKYALYAEAQYPLDPSGFTGGYDTYQNAVNAGKEVLADPDADAPAVADALEAILEAKANLHKPDGIVPSITSTQPVYTGASWNPVPEGQYALEKMVDNDESTQTWIAANQTEGDEIRFTFPKVLNMTGINVVQPSNVGADILEKADIEVSEDGQTWNKVGELTASSQLSETVTFEKTPVKYVRIVLKASKENWYQISEVRFTYEQEAENTALSDLIAEAEGLDITGVSKSLVSDLADALIAAQKKTVAGSNDTAAEEAALRTAIDAIKNAPIVEPADKKALQAAVDAAEKLKEADYTAESWSGFAAALKEAKAVLEDENATQEEVDQALSDLDKAKEALKETEAPEPVKLPYEDVKEGDWFYEYVYDVYVKKLMTGLKDTIFGPGQSLARAQFAVILYRMEGSPKVEYTEKFPDVEDGVWYTDAILWAAKAGVVTGYTGTGMFGPSDQITREQMAVMMYRYANYKNKDTSDKKSLDAFPDGNKVQVFAVDGMQWCTAKGIISGKGEEPKHLEPQGSTSRAECATIISRYTDLY